LARHCSRCAEIVILSRLKTYETPCTLLAWISQVFDSIYFHIKPVFTTKLGDNIIIFSPELELEKNYKMMVKYVGKYAVLDIFL
jgi:hypothetical protein